MAIVETGKRNKRIEFRNPTVTPDTSAGATAAYTTWFTSWAYVEKLRGDRSFDFGLDGLKNNYKMVCLYRSSMSALSKSTRILYNGKDFGLITYKLIDEENFLYEFIVEEVS